MGTSTPRAGPSSPRGPRGAWRAMLRSGEAPMGFRQAPPVPVPMPISHFLVRPRRAAAVRTNAAIDASLRGDNVRRFELLPI